MATFSRSEKILLALLAGTKFTHIVDFMVMMPLAPQLQRTLQISPAQFGVLVSSYTFSAGITSFLGIFFLDKLPRRKALLWLYVGFLLGTLFCGLADGYWQLTSARIIAGAFGGVLNALILSLIGDVFPLEKRASAMGVVMTAFSVAAILGVPIGIYLATLWSWNAPFLLIASLSAPMLLGMYLWIPKELDNRKIKESVSIHPMEDLKNVLGNRNQLNAISHRGIMVLSQFMLIPFISPYMVGNIGFEEIDLTYIYLIGGACTLTTGPLIGYWADKIGHQKAFVRLAFISIIAILFITHLPPVGMAVALVSTSLFFILISGRSIPSNTMAVSCVPSRHRGSFMSLVTALQQLAAGLAAIIGGAILVEKDNGELMNFAIIGYVATFLTLVGIWLGSKIVPAEEEEVA